MSAVASFYACSENYSMIYPLSSNFYFLKRQGFQAPCLLSFIDYFTFSDIFLMTSASLSDFILYSVLE